MMWNQRIDYLMNIEHWFSGHGFCDVLSGQRFLFMGHTAQPLCCCVLQDKLFDSARNKG